MLDRKPPFSNWRINPSHPLAKGLRFYIVCGNGYALDLVTGRVGTFSGTYGDGTMVPDGQAADLDGSDYFEFADHDWWDILTDITLVWRGVPDGTGAGTLVAKSTNDVGANTPLYFCVSTVTTLDFVRTDAAGNFSFWRGATPVSGNTTTYGVTNTAISNSACTMYVNGVPATPTLQFSAGTGVPTGNSQPLRIGRDIAGTPKQLDGRVSFVAGWDRRLPGSDMLWIHHDPYGLIEMRPDIGEFTGTSPPPPPPSNTNYLMPMLGVGDD